MPSWRLRAPLGNPSGTRLPNMTQQKIGFIGSGMMTRALAPVWASAGHEVVVGGRSADAAKRLSDELGLDGGGSLGWAAEQAEVAVLAVRWEGVPFTLQAIGRSAAGKVVVDMTNPVETDSYGIATNFRGSVAEWVQDRTDALVVKAFNLAQASVWTAPRRVDGRPLVVPIASDFNSAKSLVRGLVVAAGFSPLDVGELRHARHLESMAAVVIRRLFLGDDAHSTFAWTSV